MRRIAIALALLGLGLGCDYGLEYQEAASQGPAGIGGVVGVSRGMVEDPSHGLSFGDSSSEQGPTADRSGAPGRALAPASSFQDAEECVYLKGGHLVIGPCVLKGGTDGRKHGDPDPWSPSPSAPKDPVVDPY